ncbi:MAG: hypothetical protein IPP40_12060 [bacterium]|nr:hypothetical protein [bacterium]
MPRDGKQRVYGQLRCQRKNQKLEAEEFYWHKFRWTLRECHSCTSDNGFFWGVAVTDGGEGPVYARGYLRANELI